MADKNVLLVEGKDDLQVLRHLLRHHRIPEPFIYKTAGQADYWFLAHAGKYYSRDVGEFRSISRSGK